MTKNIIDVSHWEDPIDFKTVSATGIVAVITKATHGGTDVDETYKKYKGNAAPYKFLWGSFHFGTGDKVEAQVNNYLKYAAPTKNEMACLDFEPNPHGPTMTIAQAREWVALFQHSTGRLPMLYGGHWLKENMTGPDPLLNKCPLWLAQYGPVAVLPPGWKTYTMWQFTDGKDGPEPHTVDGVNGSKLHKCDRSQYDGSETELKKKWPFT